MSFETDDVVTGSKILHEKYQVWFQLFKRIIMNYTTKQIRKDLGKFNTSTPNVLDIENWLH